MSSRTAYLTGAADEDELRGDGDARWPRCRSCSSTTGPQLHHRLQRGGVRDTLDLTTPVEDRPATVILMNEHDLALATEDSKQDGVDSPRSRATS